MDLNIIIYDDGEFLIDKSILKIIETCYNYGYKKIGLTIQVNGENIQKLPAPPCFEVKHDNLQILTRLTIKIDDANCLYHLMRHENLKNYDLLAIEPLNEKMLNYLTSGNIEFDILTFSQIDSTSINMIKKANFSLPISKGVGIEINYSNCLSSSSQRRQMLALGQMLVDKTNSKNIILSSGSNNSFNIRSPRDVIYIGLLFGLKENQSKKSLYENTLGVIKHSELRRNISKSIIETVSVKNENIENTNIEDHMLCETLKNSSRKRKLSK